MECGKVMFSLVFVGLSVCTQRDPRVTIMDLFKRVYFRTLPSWPHFPSPPTYSNYSNFSKRENDLQLKGLLVEIALVILCFAASEPVTESFSSDLIFLNL